MVQGILKSLSSSVRGLHQAAYLLAALTLVSQVLALLRDRLFAHAFGAGQTLDMYYAAFRIPDLIFALIASLVSAYVLIPRISGAKKEETQRLLSHTTSFLIIAGGGVSLILALGMPYLLTVLFPQFVPTALFADFVFLSQMLLIQPIMLGLSGILTSVTQVHRRFVLFALSPVLYNLGIIFGVLVLYPKFGLLGIGIGVVLGALMHVIIHIPVVRHAGVMPTPTIPSPSLIWSVVKDSVPRSLALSFGALTTLVLTMFASKVGEGAVSVFTLAGNLQAVPLALIGASYATAAFPVLSEEARDKKDEAFKETITAAARHLIFWSSVIAILTIVLRAHIVRVLYGTGAFDWDATRLTAALLGILIIGLSAQGFVLLASRAFYAARRSINPLIIQAVGLVVSFLSAYVLVRVADAVPVVRYFFEALLRVEDIPGSTVLFIALGATMGQLVMGIAALLTLRTVAPGVAKKLIRPLFEGCAAGIVGGFFAYGVLLLLGNIAPLTSLFLVFTEALLAGIVGLAVSAGVLILLENREFKDLYDALRKVSFSKSLTPSGSTLNEQTHT